MLTYLLGAVRALFRYENKMMKVVVDDEMVIKRKLNSVMVAIGEYFGGGIKIVPGAETDDGLFHFLILGDLSKLDILWNLARAYRGRHISHPKVKLLSGKKIEVEAESRVLLELDGEGVGRLPARFEILEKKLPLLVD